jgi:antitoxin (DNA-binding transcriptional repressor) of toxin-antitoxin stability system
MTTLNIGVSEFRANMSAFLSQVQQGNIVRLMQRGTEIATLVPPNYAQLVAQESLIALRQTAIVGDVLSPIDEIWEATD